MFKRPGGGRKNSGGFITREMHGISRVAAWAVVVGVALAGSAAAQTKSTGTTTLQSPTIQKTAPTTGVAPTGKAVAPQIKVAPPAIQVKKILLGATLKTTPAKAVASGKAFAVAGVNWTCKGNTCTAQAPATTNGVLACQNLARRAGAVAAFRVGGRVLSAANLTRCNTGIKTATAPGTKTATGKTGTSGGFVPKKTTAPKTGTTGGFVPKKATGTGTTQTTTAPKARTSGGFLPKTTTKDSTVALATQPSKTGALAAPPKGTLRLATATQVANLQSTRIGTAQISPTALTALRTQSSQAPYITAQGRDCDDNDPTVSPRSPEVCNGKDDNCNGLVDEGVIGTAFFDRDGDRFGDSGAQTLVCPQDFLSNAQLVNDNRDCDDTNISVNPAMGNCPPQ